MLREYKIGGTSDRGRGLSVKPDYPRHRGTWNQARDRSWARAERSFERDGERETETETAE